MTHERNCRTLFINTIRVINLSYTCVNCICNFLSWFPWEGILKKIDIPYHFLFTRNCLVFAYIACNDSKVNFKKKKEFVIRRGGRKIVPSYDTCCGLIDFVNSLLVLINRACEINSTIFEWMRDTRKNKLNRRDLDFYRYFVQIQEEEFKKRKKKLWNDRSHDSSSHFGHKLLQINGNISNYCTKNSRQMSMKFIYFHLHTFTLTHNH